MFVRRGDVLPDPNRYKRCLTPEILKMVHKKLIISVTISPVSSSTALLSGRSIEKWNGRRWRNWSIKKWTIRQSSIARWQIFIGTVHLQDIPFGVESAGIHSIVSPKRITRNTRRGMECLSILSDRHNGMYRCCFLQKITFFLNFSSFQMKSKLESEIYEREISHYHWVLSYSGRWTAIECKWTERPNNSNRFFFSYISCALHTHTLVE